MKTQPSFSQYLVGTASLERPPFFYAYAAMWIHLVAGGILLGVLGSQSFEQQLTSMVVSSFCLGIVVYGVLSKGFGLLLNVGAYVASMLRLFHPTRLDSLLIVAAIVTALVSAYLLLAREYRRYNEKMSTDSEAIRGIPVWISATMGLIVLLMCVFALTLV